MAQGDRACARRAAKSIRDRGHPRPAARAAERARRSARGRLIARRRVHDGRPVGQQAGVFGGPLYTILKAVTAVQLAKKVRAEHQTPTVALFWVDAEDHDWAEISKAGILDEELSLRHITVKPVDGAGAVGRGAHVRRGN